MPQEPLATREVIRELHRLTTTSDALAAAVAEVLGMHRTDFACLDLLEWAQPATPGRLARILGITSGAMSGVLRRLEDGGWILRRPDPQDGRRQLVSLVAERHGDVAPLYGPVEAATVEALDRLPGPALTAVAEALSVINDAQELHARSLRAATDRRRP